MKRFQLEEEERRTLLEIGVGHRHARVRRRAQGLVRLAQGITQAQVAREFGVHLNSVRSWIGRWQRAELALCFFPDLQQLGFVRDLQGKRGTRRLFEHERLLNQWADAYARVLRPRTLIGRYYVTGFEGWKNWPIAEYGALWGANLPPRC